MPRAASTGAENPTASGFCCAEAGSGAGFSAGFSTGLGAGFSAGFSAAGSTGVTGSAVRGGFSGSCLGGGGRAGAVVTRRVSRWPGKIRFGLPPMVVRLVSYSACQPPSTCRSVAIAESESPGATTYGFGRTEVPVGRGPPPCSGTVRGTGACP